MSVGLLPGTVTGDYSLDDFLDAAERDDPADEETESPEGWEAESNADSVSKSESEPTASSKSESTPDREPESVAESADDPEDEGETEDAPLATDSVEPAQPTYDWSPDGAECAGCGESATTRWRQEEEYVCADCKEW